jgi:ribosomal protein S19E (S16A)
LYEEGARLLQRTDWVRDAQRLRAAKERQLEKAGKLSKKPDGEALTSRGMRALARS